MKMIDNKGEIIVQQERIVVLAKKSLDDVMKIVSNKNVHSQVSTGYAVGREEW